MNYLDWSHRLLLSFSYSAGHSVFSQESVKQYFKINISAVIPRLTEKKKKSQNTIIRSISPVAISFLWCLYFYCWYLKKQPLSNSCYLLIYVLQKGENMVSREVNQDSLYFSCSKPASTAQLLQNKFKHLTKSLCKPFQSDHSTGTRGV